MKEKITLAVLTYLRIFAKIQIAKVQLLQKIRGKKLTIVGITGSAGKSSTINACEAVLKDFFSVRTTAGSNSESGIPLNILNIKFSSFAPIDWLKYCLLAPISLIANWKSYDIYLVEMGIDGPGEPKNMSYLLKIIQPTIGIFLNVGSVHSQHFDNTLSENINKEQRESAILLKIGQEKSKLINSLPHTGYALININDPIVIKTTQITSAKKILLKPLQLSFSNYLPPASFDISISAAVSLAKLFNINQAIAIQSIQKNLILPPSRSTKLEGINNSTLIDSSYNSSPLACQEMLNVLASFRSPRIAILGDMRELGLQSQSAHEKIYRTALKSADIIISIGPETSKYFGPKSIKFNFYWQANEYIKNNQNILKNASILVKGSQNTIFLEEVVKELLANKKDVAQLCRQSPYWQKVKSDFRKSLVSI